jgi:hypothetical protein
MIGMLFLFGAKVFLNFGTQSDLIVLGLVSTVLVAQYFISTRHEIQSLKEEMLLYKKDLDDKTLKVDQRIDEIKDVKNYLSALKGGQAINKATKINGF